MTYRVPRPNVIDRVWLVAADGQWHSQCGLARQTRLDGEEIMAALSFLVKYGFAESSTAGDARFRMMTDGPSPTEAADILRVVGLEAESSSYGWEW